MNLLYPAILFVTLLIAAAIGWSLQSRLKERHTTRESIESIRLLMGMLLTFSALVLGLLTSNAKQRYDQYNNDLSAYATDLIELQHRLVTYGPESTDIRTLLRTYTAASIADSWPDEPAPPGTYPRLSPAPGVEAREFGSMLSEIDLRIEQLAPTDPFHQHIAARLRDRIATAIERRWRIILSARSTVSWPFLLILTAWLTIIFAIFGLTSPRNRLIYAVVALAALSIASPLYLILDYSGPLDGLIKLSSAPMREALIHMDRGD